MAEKTISNAVIERLPRYYRYLGELMEKKVERVSSQELAELMNLTASQVRQDFNTFGGFGQQGYGYNVKYLMSEIKKILGIDADHQMVIIGAGNLAKTLASYEGFANIGFKVIAIFDVHNRKEGKVVSNVPVYSMEKFSEFVSGNQVDVAVMAIPSSLLEEAAETVINSGIKGIWNFSHLELDLSHRLNIPPDVSIKNVHLIDSLMQLSFMMKSV